MAKPKVKYEKIEKPEKLKPLKLKRAKEFYFFPEDIATKITAEDEEEAVEELKKEMGGLKPRDVVMVRSKYLKKLEEV